jgi:endonuclease/exonuclease/phosphatase family metal-dependent hydrolase
MLRIATFNIENLDTSSSKSSPSLALRAPVLRTMLKRINADILCLQEVHGQELPNHTSQNPKRDLAALDFVLDGTAYQTFHRVCTLTSDKVPYNERNLVVLSRWPIVASHQYKNDYIATLEYRKVTAVPAESAKTLGWERPILRAEIDIPNVGLVNIINLHLKSRLATSVNGQKLNNYSWASAAGWAEGYFLSSIKRVGQALETRVLLDDIFSRDPEANIVVCGDFNSEPGEVPVEAICGRVENTGNAEIRNNVMIPCSLAIADSVRFSHLHQGKGNLLDHMLISHSLFGRFVRSAILNEDLHDESLPFASDLKFPESDHAPFVSEFLLGD